MSELRDFWFDQETLEYIGESPLPDDVVLPKSLIAVRDFSASEARRRVLETRGVEEEA